MVKCCLSNLLGDRKMSQAELSRKTGIRPNTISELYHGSTERINLEHIDRICEAINCTVEELLLRQPNPISKTGLNPILEPHASRKIK